MMANQNAFISDNPRVFLAVPFSEGFKEAILGCQSELKGKFRAMHWIPPANFHLTIKFFGETPQETLVTRVIPRLRDLISGKPTFEVAFKRFGWFGSPRQIRVLHLEGEAPELVELAIGILREFPDERPRPFKAHLTLAKGLKQAEPEDIKANEVIVRRWQDGGAESAGLPVVNAKETITRLVLMESVFKGRAVYYEERAEFLLT